jgi:hypothetical protein
MSCGFDDNEPGHGLDVIGDIFVPPSSLMNSRRLMFWLIR